MTDDYVVELNRPLEWQDEVIRDRKRFNILRLGRRAGKTELGKLLLAYDIDVITKPMAWFAPTYKDMLEVWRAAVETFEPISTRVSSSERRIELMTGGVIEFWSLENKNAGRGRKYARVIVDEAAFVAGLFDIWVMSILPTLADFAGDAYIFSTPKGRNDFYRLWLLAEKSPDLWSTWHMPTHVNPYISESELLILKGSMTEDAWRQEVLAEFLDDGGGVFRYIERAATATPQDEYEVDEEGEAHEYAIGVDWGKHGDFSVFAVFDATLNELVYIESSNKVDYTLQRGRLKALCERFDPYVVLAEKNSIGDPNIEMLLSDDIPVEPFNTTNASKKNAVESFALALEQQAVKIVPDAELVRQLGAYEGVRLPSGLLRYTAPQGDHDDYVMAAIIGWQAVVDFSPSVW